MNEQSQRLTYTEQEFCNVVGISRPTAYRLRKAGKLPHVRLKGRILYTRGQINAFLASHEQNAVGAAVPTV